MRKGISNSPPVDSEPPVSIPESLTSIMKPKNSNQLSTISTPVRSNSGSPVSSISKLMYGTKILKNMMIDAILAPFRFGLFSEGII